MPTLAVVSLLAMVGCAEPDLPLSPASPETVEALFAEQEVAVSYALAAIRDNPWGWDDGDFARLKAFLVDRAQAAPADDPARALFVLLEARRSGGAGAAFASLPDLLRVYNGSRDSGVRLAVLEALPDVASEHETLAFLESVATRSRGRTPLAAEAAVRALARMAPEGCGVLERALARRAVTDAAAAAVARALLDPDGPTGPGVPDGCRSGGWGRLFRGGGP